MKDSIFGMHIVVTPDESPCKHIFPSMEENVMGAKSRRLSWGAGGAISLPLMKFSTLVCLLLVVLPVASHGGKPAPVNDPTAGPARNISPELRAALEKLKLPGVKINLEEWCVDVDSRVCLKEGLLELIACTKDTKEHESIIVIDAKPSHVHTALLLIGAKPGNPAQRQPIDPEMTRFRDIPPSGGPVNVFLAFKDPEGKQVEFPISDFIKRADDHDGSPEPATEGGDGKFPTHTFLFAGSILVGEGDGPRQYLCDSNGNVISISTFGDELLCLAGFHEQANGALMWQVDGTKLPAVDSKIILRLRPAEGKKPPGPASEPKAGEKPAGK
jgi:hypothetical protein